MAGCITLVMDSPCESPFTGRDQGRSGGWDSGGSGLSGADGAFGLGAEHPVADAAVHLPAGTRLGDVTIVRLLGAGGMGCVYECRQDAPRRQVALKLLRRRGRDGGFERRFAREAEVLAGLRHPHIAQVHTSGTHVINGVAIPSYVMELVPEAVSLTGYAEARLLSIRDRVVLFGKVCGAVAHAHGQAVVHRDLKPANILVGSDGEPKVIDFGVARLVGCRGEENALQTLATAAGEIVGTLQYMSPEQIVGGSDVDGRCDVYALGLVLHELIVGRPPYDLRACSYAEAVRIVTGRGGAGCDAVERAAAHAVSRGDARTLATITATCLQPEPADRYQSAASLAADVARWLADEPIHARPPTPWESARRFARRHRGVAWAAGLAVATLLVAVVGISLASLRAERLRRDAERQVAATRAQLYFSTILLAADARDRGNVAEARRLVAEARGLVPGAEHPQPLELRCLAATLDDSTVAIDGFEGTVAAVAWAADATWLAAGDATGAVRLRRLGSRDEAGVSLGMHDGAVWSVAVAPDGRRLASAAADATVKIWNTATGDCEATLRGHAGTVYSVAFAPDGGTLASASRDGSVRLWDTATWQERSALRGHAGTVYAARFSPDGVRLATASLDRTAKLWDVATGEVVTTLEGHDQRVFSAAFSADGRQIVTASEDATARVWDIETAAELQRFVHPFRVNAAVFIGATGRIATVAADDVVRVWDQSRPGSPRQLFGHSGPVWAVAATADGSGFATGSADATVRTWNGSGEPPNVLRESDRVLTVAGSFDGRMLATGLADGSVVLRDAVSLEPRGRLAAASGRANAVAFLADGSMLAVAGDDGCVSLWDSASHERQLSIAAHEKRVYSVAGSADGRRLVTASDDRTARIWNAATGEAVGMPLRHQRRVFCGTFSPDGHRVVTACEDRVARVWDSVDGRELIRLEGHAGPVNWVAFSADGRRIATAGSDGTVRLWHADTGQAELVLTGPARQIWKAAFSPDGSRVVGVSADGTVQVWDAATGRAALMLRGHTDQVWGVAFTTRDTLVTGSWDGTTRIWGVSPAEIVRRRTDQ
jgi:WD40 repeat protein/tRNA A-37 threonylcarbamoyl transferase component Bud32